ncbi:hypothetical protein ACODT3_39905 [Streptomyces sp. 4.24]|uniref:hypothetical protein n=1 Tax=Streptomyces tritrimontium TaxID=3406573 RepID=UPI003BB6EAB0
MDHIEHFEAARHRRRGRLLNDGQRDLADRLQDRANRLREQAGDDGDSLSIRDAVALAAVQLGLAPPTAGPEAV